MSFEVLGWLKGDAAARRLGSSVGGRSEQWGPFTASMVTVGSEAYGVRVVRIEIFRDVSGRYSQWAMDRWLDALADSLAETFSPGQDRKSRSVKHRRLSVSGLGVPHTTNAARIIMSVEKRNGKWQQDLAYLAYPASSVSSATVTKWRREYQWVSGFLLHRCAGCEISRRH